MLKSMINPDLSGKRTNLVFGMLLIMLLVMRTGLFAQNVAINADGSNPDESAMLDVQSAYKGLLIPNVALTGTTDGTTITTPAVSLLVYNTETGSGVRPGYYYNSGTTDSPVWTRFVTTTSYVWTRFVTTTLAIIAIGDSYLGGKIFWLDETGQHGLIAATADQSSGIQWFNGTYTTTNAVGDGIGAGIFNTERISVNQSTGSYAAQICANYQNDGYGDWYLPSKYELNLLFLQRAAVGGFSSDSYWSSTEDCINNAWWQNFNSGSHLSYPKEGAHNVRAIRAF